MEHTLTANCPVSCPDCGRTVQVPITATIEALIPSKRPIATICVDQDVFREIMAQHILLTGPHPSVHPTFVEEVPAKRPCNGTPGCCSDCNGRGGAYGEPCSSCFGTGHSHPEEVDRG